MRDAPGREDAPGRDTGAGTHGFMDSPDGREHPALHAKRIGGLLTRALVSSSQTNDSVSAR